MQTEEIHGSAVWEQMQLLCVSLSRLWRKNIRRVDAELLLSYILVFYWFHFLALIGVLHLYTLFVQVANEPRWCLKIKRKLHASSKSHGLFHGLFHGVLHGSHSFLLWMMGMCGFMCCVVQWVTACVSMCAFACLYMSVSVLPGTVHSLCYCVTVGKSWVLQLAWGSYADWPQCVFSAFSCEGRRSVRLGEHDLPHTVNSEESKLDGDETSGGQCKWSRRNWGVFLGSAHLLHTLTHSDVIHNSSSDGWKSGL